MTHKEKLLRYFKEEKNTITTMEGFTQLHILHIPSVIRDLKEDGYTIKSSYIKYKDRWGKSRPFKKYHLIEDDVDMMNYLQETNK
jgi:heme-degrading monooxygenase HmoA